MQTPIPAMENECIYSIAVNKNILIGGGNSTIWKFDMLSQTFLNSIQIKKVGIITKVVFSPNRKKVAVCGREGLLLTNDSLNTVTYLKGHTDWINNICFSPDNRFLYSCSGSMFGNDKTIRKWDVATGKLLTTFESNENDIENIAISKDGLKIWSSGHEGNFRLWNTQTGKCLAIIWPIKTKDSINYCFFSPEGHYVGNEEYLKRFIISNTNKFPAFNLEASKAYFNSIR